MREEYERINYPRISKVTAIVGTWTKALAIPCGDYVKEIWPLVRPQVLNSWTMRTDFTKLQKPNEGIYEVSGVISSN